jgi:hypothetical protein
VQESGSRVTAATGRHDQENILASHHPFNNLLLGSVELVKAEDFFKLTPPWALLDEK